MALAGKKYRAALAKVEDHIAGARARGATVATGGARHALVGSFFQPTVLTGMTLEMGRPA